MASEQSGSKSDWKFMEEIFTNYPWEGKIKQNLLTAIQESWNHFDKEYYSKLVKSMPKKIKVGIKARGGAAKYSF